MEKVHLRDQALLAMHDTHGSLLAEVANLFEDVVVVKAAISDAVEEMRVLQELLLPLHLHWCWTGGVRRKSRGWRLGAGWGG